MYLSDCTLLRFARHPLKPGRPFGFWQLIRFLAGLHICDGQTFDTRCRPTTDFRIVFAYVPLPLFVFACRKWRWSYSEKWIHRYQQFLLFFPSWPIEDTFSMSHENFWRNLCPYVVVLTSWRQISQISRNIEFYLKIVRGVILIMKIDKGSSSIIIFARQ